MEDRRPASLPTPPHRLRLGTLVLVLISASLQAGLVGARCGGPGGELDLGCAAPPNTDLVAQPDFDFFAWNTFIALSWPALEGTEENGYLRGFPDLERSFVDARPGDTTVWESFKEKREVFNHPVKQPPWNGQPDYGPLRPAKTLVGTPAKADAEHPNVTARSFHQGSKTTFDTFDETVEVASEALETTLGNGGSQPGLSAAGRPSGLARAAP